MLIVVPTLLEAKLLFQSQNLDHLEFGQVVKLKEYDGAYISLIGFGPVNAGVHSAIALQNYQSKTSSEDRFSLLIGIAGAYDIKKHPVGKAFLARQVALDGVGVGMGELHKSSLSLGWENVSEAWQNVDMKHELLAEQGANVLTVCSASANTRETSLRKKSFPEAELEEMEAAPFALACRANMVPFGVIRGVSNAVGQQDKSSWNIPGALLAAKQLLQSFLFE